MALCLQIQVSLFRSENYDGLRLNLADTALPVAGLFILLSLLMKKTSWPAWQKPFGLAWVLAPTLALAWGLVNGYLASGAWSQWALVNKFLGWFVLMAYLGAGAWVATNFSDLRDRFFTKPFLVFGALSCVAAPLLILLPVSGLPDFAQTPYAGLMANPNAYAFLLCAVCAFATLRFLQGKDTKWIAILLWAGLPFVLFFSGSRALWLCFSLLFIFFLFCDWRQSLVFLLPAFCAGLLGAFLLQAYTGSPLAARPFAAATGAYDYRKYEDETVKQVKYQRSIDYRRIENIKLSLGLWLENPVLGAGLGAAQSAQIDEHGKLLAVIDNTILWLLAETGLAGAGIFAGVYVVMILALRRKTLDPGDDGYFAFCAIVMLLIFGFYSLLHEVLYTRFMWFILGLALAVPRTHQA